MIIAETLIANQFMTPDVNINTTFQLQMMSIDVTIIY